MERRLESLLQGLLHSILLLYHLIDDENVSSDKGEGEGVEVDYMVCWWFGSAGTNRRFDNLQGSTLVEGGKLSESDASDLY